MGRERGNGTRHHLGRLVELGKGGPHGRAHCVFDRVQPRAQLLSLRPLHVERGVPSVQVCGAAGGSVRSATRAGPRVCSCVLGGVERGGSRQGQRWKPMSKKMELGRVALAGLTLAQPACLTTPLLPLAASLLALHLQTLLAPSSACPTVAQPTYKCERVSSAGPRQRRQRVMGSR